MRDLYLDPAKRAVTGRFYHTLWFENATGYSGKFLTAVQDAVRASAFPEIVLERSLVHTGGCYFFGKQFDYGGEKMQAFEGYLFHSMRADMAPHRCIYKATEFGNILHISIIFYQDKESSGGCSDLNRPMSELRPVGCSTKKLGLLEQEYKEVFERLVWMIIEEATKRLGEEPLHTERSRRNSDQESGKKSGLAGLLGKLPI